MIANTIMNNMLSEILMSDIYPINHYPIWEKKSSSGFLYWGSGHFWGVDKQLIGANDDLTDLEWNGNEIRIDDIHDVLILVKQGLGIIFAWKIQMEQEYPKTAFDILLSVDEGDKEISPSVTLRFWAVRNGEHYVQPSTETLEGFCQPVLIEQVNVKSI